MKKCNVLVSGASGVVGYGILRSLRKSSLDLNLHATSIYEDSVAQCFSDQFTKALPTDDPGYIDWLCETIDRMQIKFMIPGIEIDLYKWSDNSAQISSAGATILLNKKPLIDLSRDKWDFYCHSRNNNINSVIDTSLETSFDKISKDFGLPFIIKPRRGFGRRGFQVVKDSETFSLYSERIGGELIVQPYVGSDEDEYSASIFGDGEGGIFCANILKRKLGKEGFTEKAEVIEDNDCVDHIRYLCKHFKPVGPTNFQFRLHKGDYKLLEINPRVSSSTSIRTAFGYNECAMAVEYFVYGKKPAAPEVKRGRAIRYVEDFIIYEASNNF